MDKRIRQNVFKTIAVFLCFALMLCACVPSARASFTGTAVLIGGGLLFTTLLVSLGFVDSSSGGFVSTVERLVNQARMQARLNAYNEAKVYESDVPGEVYVPTELVEWTKNVLVDSCAYWDGFLDFTASDLSVGDIVPKESPRNLATKLKRIDNDFYTFFNSNRNSIWPHDWSNKSVAYYEVAFDSQGVFSLWLWPVIDGYTLTVTSTYGTGGRTLSYVDSAGNSYNDYVYPVSIFYNNGSLDFAQFNRITPINARYAPSFSSLNGLNLYYENFGYTAFINSLGSFTTTSFSYTAPTSVPLEGESITAMFPDWGSKEVDGTLPLRVPGTVDEAGSLTQDEAQTVTGTGSDVSSGFFEGVIDSILSAIRGFWQDVVDWFSRLLEWVQELFNELVRQGIQVGEFIRSFWEGLKASLSEVFSEVLEGIRTAIQDLNDQSWLNQLKGFLASGFGFTNIWHYVVTWVGSLGAFLSVLFSVWNNLPYAMVVPVYATAVIVIVFGIYRRFIH